MGLQQSAVYHLLSGQAFFTGALLVVAGMLLVQGSEQLRIKRAASFAWQFGLVLVFFSTTPLPLVLCALLAVSMIGWWLAQRRATNSRAGRAWCAVAVAGWVIAVAGEVPYHRLPHVAARPSSIAVIGDSLSVAYSQRAPTWTQILEQGLDIPVHNHAVAGATAGSALVQCQAVSPEQDLVILEIGGNDLLQRFAAHEFEHDLNALLSQLRSGSERTILMFELPLPPLAYRYGAAQRRAAKRYNVRLIPKNVLLKVLLSTGNTVDSLHFSANGHQMLGDQMLQVFAR